jgi:hypothetical protein
MLIKNIFSYIHHSLWRVSNWLTSKRIVDIFIGPKEGGNMYYDYFKE